MTTTTSSCPTGSSTPDWAETARTAEATTAPSPTRTRACRKALGSPKASQYRSTDRSVCAPLRVHSLCLLLSPLFTPCYVSLDPEMNAHEPQRVPATAAAPGVCFSSGKNTATVCRKQSTRNAIPSSSTSAGQPVKHSEQHMYENILQGLSTLTREGIPL